MFFLPFLIPAQWFAARHSHLPGRVLFTVLAALLVGEVAWMVGYELANETVAVVIGLATGLVVGALFFSTSARRS